MGHTARQKWDRHAIFAEIRRQYGSLKALAEAVGETKGRLSLSLLKPYPKVDRSVAKAIDVPLNELWPDRYHPDGTRKLAPRSRTSRRPASSRNVRGK